MSRRCARGWTRIEDAPFTFYHDNRLQRSVKVEPADPVFARLLQQVIGGAEGEIRVCMQHLFQCWGSCGPNPKRRDMLMHAATEEKRSGAPRLDASA